MFIETRIRPEDDALKVHNLEAVLLDLIPPLNGHSMLGGVGRYFFCDNSLYTGRAKPMKPGLKTWLLPGGEILRNLDSFKSF